MKNDPLKKLIRKIDETLNFLSEEHTRGEWWIDNNGDTIFADGDVGESNHEGVVIQHLTHEILEHFGVGSDEGSLYDYEDDLKRSLIDDGRLTDDDIATWDNIANSKTRGGPAIVIINKLLEDKVYDNEEQATDAVFIAYGSSRDARDYAMKYWRWKVMKTVGSEIEIQSWNLTAEDLSIIVRGVWDIMGEDDPENNDDPDNEIGEDGYPGPRINITVQSNGKRYYDIPLVALEKKLPQIVHRYASGVHTGYTENIK